MFPNIQFIVTTHSPFVISSLENVVICDLEYRTVLTDLSAYSYDGIVEYYYNSDKYSEK
jgi:predicted ATP-binding protein involved in virulence